MPRPRTLDRDAILAAALALGEADGVAAITMQGVARRLGVTAMALYRHVGNKDALLDGVLERMLAEVAAVAPRGGDWRSQLIAFGRALRTVARRHPSVFPLLLVRPAVTAQARGVTERVVAALRAAGVPARRLVHAERIVSTLALGFAIGDATGRFPRHAEVTFRTLVEFALAGLAPLRTKARRTE